MQKQLKMETIKVEKISTSLREYTRLIIAFFFSSLLIVTYQYANLYLKGVIDGIFSISFVLALVNHIGFSSLIGLVLVAPYHFLERFKPSLGFKIIYGLLLLLLGIEALLVTHYTTTLIPLGVNTESNTVSYIFRILSNSGSVSFTIILLLIPVILLFFYGYKFTKKLYHHINKMFPLTIIFFTVFVATLLVEGKPINQNKTKYLVFNMLHTFSDIEEINKLGNEEKIKEKFSEEEIVWINSQFNGKNHDYAFITARQFAFENEPEKALLLLRYILSEVPNHIDARILKGRINAWKGNYDEAISVFEECLLKNSSYDDIYSALLDVYYWSDNNEQVVTLIDVIIKNSIASDEVNHKVNRAYEALNKKGVTTNTFSNHRKIEAFLASKK